MSTTRPSGATGRRAMRIGPTGRHSAHHVASGHARSVWNVQRLSRDRLRRVRRTQEARRDRLADRYVQSQLSTQRDCRFMHLFRPTPAPALCASRNVRVLCMKVFETQASHSYAFRCGRSPSKCVRRMPYDMCSDRHFFPCLSRDAERRLALVFALVFALVCA